MKKTTLILLSFILLTACESGDDTSNENSNCGVDTLDQIVEIISSQEDLETFAQLGYRAIPNARLLIENIEDLSPLGCLTEVAELKIRGLEASTLNGLQNITKVQKIEIEVNPNIQNLEGLNLIEELDELRISGNSSLVNFEGLDNLQRVNFLYVNQNPQLQNFNGMESVTTTGFYSPEGVLDGFISITNNPLLTSLGGMENFQDPLAFVLIEELNSLVELADFSNVTIMGGISIGNSSAIESVIGFDNVVEAGAISFGANASLQTALFPSLTRASSFYLQECPLYNSLEGFSELTELYGVNGDFTLQIDDVPSLTTLNGFEKLGYTEGLVDINDFADSNLTNMCALELLVNNYLAQGDDVIMFPLDNNIDANSECTGGQNFLIDFYGTCDCN